eukprot:gb/GECG01010400.1/.p1 GENE.gb/GECG01010400.1/~~gb/GECG01010400.1/.p1  ORF type:complete len:115 (+),score=11.00 gb/GECG01010400.1/:1-345(+)
MASLSRFASRTASMVPRQQRLAASGPSKRFMSSGESPEELREGVSMWYKASIWATGLVVVPCTLYMIYVEATHAHHERVDYPHMKQRRKPFPWKAHGCDFFDWGCKREFKKQQQ